MYIRKPIFCIGPIHDRIYLCLADRPAGFELPRLARARGRTAGHGERSRRAWRSAT
jgi:hypothetical protein